LCIFSINCNINSSAPLILYISNKAEVLSKPSITSSILIANAKISSRSIGVMNTLFKSWISCAQKNRLYVRILSFLLQNLLNHFRHFSHIQQKNPSLRQGYYIFLSIFLLIYLLFLKTFVYSILI